MFRLFTNRFSIFQLMTIALLAALGIALKSVIAPLIYIFTGVLHIPGGVLAGGLYMMFLVLALSLTGKRGAATLCGFCQGLIVPIIGVSGSQGALTVLSYTLTGLAIDLVMLGLRHKACCLLCCILGSIAANLTGTVIVNVIFYGLPPLPLALILIISTLSGGVGGVLAWTLSKQLKKLEALA